MTVSELLQQVHEVLQAGASVTSVKELKRLLRELAAYEAIVRLCPHGFVRGECGECELS